MASHDRHLEKLLDVIESNPMVSQRSLAKDLGIALGLTNLLVRKIARNGWIRLIRVRPNRVRYLITPAGLAAKAKMYRAQLAASLRFYMETRDRIQASLETLSRNWPQPSKESRERRIVLYGVGEVAEIGFVCLQGGAFRLIGIVDEGSKRSFLGLPVHSLDRLHGTNIDGASFDCLVIMSLEDVDVIRARVIERGVPREIVHAI